VISFISAHLFSS